MDAHWLNWLPDATCPPPAAVGLGQISMPDDHSKPPACADSLVCGRKMTIAPENFYPAEDQGRVIYFCTQFCLETFRADPERFYIAHSRSKDTPNNRKS